MQMEIWETLTPEEKKEALFREQKHTLDLFLERNAISQEQYDYSLSILVEKMGVSVSAAQQNAK